MWGNVNVFSVLVAALERIANVKRDGASKRPLWQRFQWSVARNGSWGGNAVRPMRVRMSLYCATQVAQEYKVELDRVLYSGNRTRNRTMQYSCHLVSCRPPCCHYAVFVKYQSRSHNGRRRHRCFTLLATTTQLPFKYQHTMHSWQSCTMPATDFLLQQSTTTI